MALVGSFFLRRSCLIRTPPLPDRPPPVADMEGLDFSDSDFADLLARGLLDPSSPPVNETYDGLDLLSDDDGTPPFDSDDDIEDPISREDEGDEDAENGETDEANDDTPAYHGPYCLHRRGESGFNEGLDGLLYSGQEGLRRTIITRQRSQHTRPQLLPPHREQLPTFPPLDRIAFRPQATASSPATRQNQQPFSTASRTLSQPSTRTTATGHIALGIIGRSSIASRGSPHQASTQSPAHRPNTYESHPFSLDSPFFSRTGPLDQLNRTHTTHRSPSTPRHRNAQQNSDDLLDLLATGNFSSPSILNHSSPVQQQQRRQEQQRQEQLRHNLTTTSAVRDNLEALLRRHPNRTPPSLQTQPEFAFPRRNPNSQSIMPQTRRRTEASRRRAVGNAASSDDGGRSIIGRSRSSSSDSYSSVAETTGVSSNAANRPPAAAAAAAAAMASASATASSSRPNSNSNLPSTFLGPAALSSSSSRAQEATASSNRKRRRSGETASRAPGLPSAVAGSINNSNGQQQQENDSQSPERSSKRRVPENPIILDDDLFGSDDGDIEVVNLTNVDRPGAEKEEEDTKQEEKVKEEEERESKMVKLATFQCVICMDDVTNLTVTHCGHLFCSECLHSSLHIDATRRICPICRQKIELPPSTPRPPTSRSKAFKGFFPLELKLMTRNRQGKQPERRPQ